MQLPEFILYIYNWLNSKLKRLNLGSGSTEASTRQNARGRNTIEVAENIIVKRKKDGDKGEEADLRSLKIESDISDIRQALESISNDLSQRIAKIEKTAT